MNTRDERQKTHYFIHTKLVQHNHYRKWYYDKYFGAKHCWQNLQLNPPVKIIRTLISDIRTIITKNVFKTNIKVKINIKVYTDLKMTIFNQSRL